MRKVNDLGISKIKQWEGLRLSAYKDQGGVLTIGYGHTSAAGAPEVYEGMKITEAEAEKILRRDLSKFEARVSSLVKVELNDNQFAALVSFDLNTGALHKSTLLKKLNQGQYEAVPKELLKWVNVKGKHNQGLINRRNAEIGLWNTGSFVSSNYVEAEPEVKSTDILKSPKDLIASASSLGFSFTALSSLSSISGPLAYALAFVAIAGTLGLGYYLYTKWSDEKATTTPVDTTEAEESVSRTQEIEDAVNSAIEAYKASLVASEVESTVEVSEALPEASVGQPEATEEVKVEETKDDATVDVPVDAVV